MSTIKPAHNLDLSKMEWPTVALIVFSYSLWILLLIYGHKLPAVVWIIASGLNITLFMSVTHEVVHGHPTRHDMINRLLILLPIGWTIPYERFRDTHIQHHITDELTDPFDDPESWYLSKHQWISQSKIARALLVFNNTLLGRMLIGPVIGLMRFYISEITGVSQTHDDQKNRIAAWLTHFALCGIMIMLITSFSDVSAWHWFAAIYLGHCILQIRTFLEHQASTEHFQRTVIIERPCPIAFLFLFNNFHFIHHNKPHIPWYRLPRIYKQEKDDILAQESAYVYRSYAEIIMKYFLRSKEPVAHPFLPNS